MVESWLTRPFSRAARNRYRDMDLNIEVHTTTESTQDPPPPHYRRKASFRMRPLSPLIPLSPISLSAFRSPFSSIRRKRSDRLADLGSISGPVGPVTVQGDPTAIRSAFQSSHAKDPFLDSESEKIRDANFNAPTAHAPPYLSALTEVMEERDHHPSLQRITTTDDFHRAPASIDSHSSLSHYSDSPFSDFSTLVGHPTGGPSSGYNRLSMESGVRSLSITRSQNYIPPDSLLLNGSPVQPMSFAAFINETQGD